MSTDVRSLPEILWIPDLAEFLKDTGLERVPVRPCATCGISMPIDHDCRARSEVTS